MVIFEGPKRRFSDSVVPGGGDPCGCVQVEILQLLLVAAGDIVTRSL